MNKNVWVSNLNLNAEWFRTKESSFKCFRKSDFPPTDLILVVQPPTVINNSDKRVTNVLEGPAEGSCGTEGQGSVSKLGLSNRSFPFHN